MSEYAAAVGDPERWLLQARQLSAAAKKLLENFGEMSRKGRTESEIDVTVGMLKGSLLLLSGAVENALKAVKVARGGISIRNGKVDRDSIGGGRSGHDLAKLADEAGLPLSSVEGEFVSRLTPIALWAGKYHAPLDEAAYQAALGSEPRQISLPTDLRTVDGLIDKAAEQIKLLQAST